MYKDKPYFQPRRTTRNQTALRVLYTVFAAFVITFLYVFWGSWGGPPAIVLNGNTGEDLWKWIQTFDKEDDSTSKKVDWEERRQKVKDVFTVSWDSYETYAWGELRIFLKQVIWANY